MKAIAMDKHVTLWRLDSGELVLMMYADKVSIACIHFVTETNAFDAFNLLRLTITGVEGLQS